MDTATLKRIDSKLTALLGKQSQDTLLKAKDVQSLTGWDKYERQRRMKVGQLKQIKKNGIWYSLNSIPQIFIKK